MAHAYKGFQYIWNSKHCWNTENHCVGTYKHSVCTDNYCVGKHISIQYWKAPFIAHVIRGSNINETVNVVEMHRTTVWVGTNCVCTYKHCVGKDLSKQFWKAPFMAHVYKGFQYKWNSNTTFRAPC